MKFKLFTIILILFFQSATLYSQKENWNWCFYDGVGISFNNKDTLPVAFNGSMLYFFKTPLYYNTFSTLSRANGELLLYTGGGKSSLGGNVHYDPLWNSAHSVVKYDSYMNTFIWTRSKLIAPYPGKDNLFYIIKHKLTYNHELEPIQLLYDVADITKNNGAGEIILKDKIISDSKDYDIHSLALLKHENNIDYWLATYGYHNGTYQYVMYLLTSKGISDTVEITSGLAAGENPLMISSPDGQFLAKIIVTKDFIVRKYDKDIRFYNLAVEISDFDNGTGKLKRKIVPVCDTCNINDLEFSPDSKKIYISVERAYHQLNDYKLVKSMIYQFTNNIDKTQVIKSKRQVGNIINDLQYTGTALPPPIDPDGSPGVYSSLRNGPNGKLYIMRQDTNFLSAINNPNANADSLKFSYNELSLGNSKCMGRFPVLLHNHYNVKLEVNAESPICELDDLKLNTKISSNNYTNVYEWTGPDNFSSSEKSPVIKASRLKNMGWYHLCAIINGAKIYDSVFVDIKPLAKPELYGSASMFENEMKIYRTKNNLHRPVLWEITGGNIIGPNNADSVAVRWGTAGIGKVVLWMDNGEVNCKGYRELNITISPWPDVMITGNSEVCVGDTAIYSATKETYLLNTWNVLNGKVISSNDKEVVINWNKSGIGTVLLFQENTQANKLDTGRLEVQVYQLPSKPGITKKGNVLETTPQYSHQWYMNNEAIIGETNYYITPRHSGRYQVQTIDSNGCKSILSDPIDITLGFEDKVNQHKLRITPNPAKQFIEFTSDAKELMIYNLLGELVIHEHNIGADENTFKIDVSGLKQGVFMIVTDKDYGIFVKLN